jgi:ribosomal protein S6--L-glutamate ligase
LLLEVNSSPGLEGIEKATEKNVAGSIIEELERQLGWNASTKNVSSKNVLSQLST